MTTQAPTMFIPEDEEHVVNLCLMTNFDKQEVFDSESVLDYSNHKELEEAFDNLLNDTLI